MILGAILLSLLAAAFFFWSAAAIDSVEFEGSWLLLLFLGSVTLFGSHLCTSNWATDQVLGNRGWTPSTMLTLPPTPIQFVEEPNP